jgi:hypothetical protein
MKATKSLAERRLFLAGIGAASTIDDDYGRLHVCDGKVPHPGRRIGPRWNLVAVVVAFAVVATTIELLPTLGTAPQAADAQSAAATAPAPQAARHPAAATTAAPQNGDASADARSLAERVALFPVLQAEVALDAAGDDAGTAAAASRVRRRI